MLPVPRSLPEFHRMFPDEEACVAYLFQVRWPDGFVCPECGSRRGYWIAKDRRVNCGDCRTVTYLTAGSMMHRSHMPLMTWFYAAFLESTLTPGMSTLQFQSQMGLSRYETAFQMLHKLRAAMVNPDRGLLTGIVQVDDTYIGGVARGGRGGRSLESGKVLVVGAVEERHRATADPTEGKSRYERAVRGLPTKSMYAGRIRFRVIPDATTEHLEKFVKESVETGSTVITDGWSGYYNLDALGYHHNVEVQRGDPEKAKHLQLIHLEISNLKTYLKGTYHSRVEQQHMQTYLNEFCFRHNRRFLEAGVPFARILQFGMKTGPQTYEQLYHAGKYGEHVHVNGLLNGLNSLSEFVRVCRNCWTKKAG